MRPSVLLRQGLPGSRAAPVNRSNPSLTSIPRIVAAKQRRAAADVSAWEREIDELVYALYGLTPEEIKLVEGETH